uniref:Ig-like domain-containing protein n=2 Tax=Phasianus colchicus TaxID=9054 RepID=A0A669QKN8_PHACC
RRCRCAVAPEVALFSEDPVELDEPNVLICYADRFWPPVATIEWRRNGEPLSDGVYDSVYYGRPDLLFRKFSYLPFVPRRGDVYTCAVRHWAAEGATERLWGEI